MHFLYTLVRTDLPTEAQAVQAMHAVAEASFDGRPWSGHPTFVFLSVKNREELLTECQHLESAGLKGRYFTETEPADWHLTAASFLVLENQRECFMHLPLWRVNVWKLIWERLTKKKFRLPSSFPQLS